MEETNETDDVSSMYPFGVAEQGVVPHTLSTPNPGTQEAAIRTREVEDMYALYNDLMSQPYILDWVVFQKFTPLFSKEVLDSINPMDKTQTEPIKLLSEEFLSMINPYKEYHVRMPDGKMHTFPPIFSPVGRLADNMTNALDIFKNIMEKCTDQSWKRKDATDFMVTAMTASQNPEVVEYQTKKYEKYAAEINQQIHGSDKEETSEDTEVATEVISGVKYILD